MTPGPDTCAGTCVFWSFVVTIVSSPVPASQAGRAPRAKSIRPRQGYCRFYYLEQHFIKGRAWRDLSHFSHELERFTLEELDVRVHSTTGVRPIGRFEQEQSLLTPLPTPPFIGTHETLRKVNWDCLLSFANTRYSVPWAYAGKQVWIRVSQGHKLIIRNQKGEVIACHLL